MKAKLTDRFKTDKVMVIYQSKMENGLHPVVTASLGVPTFQRKIHIEMVYTIFHEDFAEQEDWFIKLLRIGYQNSRCSGHPYLPRINK